MKYAINFAFAVIIMMWLDLLPNATIESDAEVTYKSEIPISEYNALIDLFQSTDGENWKHGWDFSAPVYSWYGVEVKDGHVTGLNLFDNDLKGEIPNTISSLSNLKSLNLSFNRLEGELPSSITELTALEGLRLEMNNFKDELPNLMDSFKNLKDQPILDISLEKIKSRLNSVN
ncbi:MAG: hypothetical protein ACPGYU_03045 [Flavobacteriaceae bacterium]